MQLYYNWHDTSLPYVNKANHAYQAWVISSKSTNALLKELYVPFTAGKIFKVKHLLGLHLFTKSFGGCLEAYASSQHLASFSQDSLTKDVENNKTEAKQKIKPSCFFFFFSKVYAVAQEPQSGTQNGYLSFCCGNNIPLSVRKSRHDSLLPVAILEKLSGNVALINYFHNLFISHRPCRTPHLQLLCLASLFSNSI